ncbi:hypothetical protein [Dactylosporangium sp. CA-092794]|uniref:hypothetical protein n=1 Tax=Dactylosporangium sp. CA-092794 TaxID=3239929 RepID=UPI003D912268
MKHADKSARRPGTRRWLTVTGALTAAVPAAVIALHSPGWALALGTAASVFAAIAGVRR